MRDAHLRPHAEAFFAWAAVEYEKVRHERGLLRSAFGYAVRQKDALLRVFDDGRLVLDNNRSERALRGAIAIGRNYAEFSIMRRSPAIIGESRDGVLKGAA